MKKITYFCIILCFSSIMTFLWNCTDPELVKYSPQVPHENFSIEEAKEFFEKQYSKNVLVTRALNKKKKKRLISPGNFVPQWEKAIASSRSGLACYDIPIENDVHYKALYTTYHNGKAKAYSVNVYQKLVVVKNQSTGNMGTYILNLIPSAEYDKKHLKQVGNRFINCADKGGFSGIAFYMIPNLNRILRVNYYENGIKKKGVFLLGKNEQMEEKMRIAHEILHGVVTKGKKKATTRGYGEDDWWEYDDWWDDNDYDDEDDDDYDDSDKDDLLWDIDSGAFLDPDDFDSGNGTFEETAMKKIILIFYALTIFILAYAQVPTNKSVQQILMSKTWHLGKDSNTGFRFVFTRDSMGFYVVGAYGYDNFKGKQSYDLSNTKDSIFDSKKKVKVKMV